MIPNKKLVRICNNNYYFLLDGVEVAKGPLSRVKAVVADKYQIKDVDLAVAQMRENGHSVADFGIMGGFITTQTFEAAHLGPNSTNQYKEAQ